MGSICNTFQEGGINLFRCANYMISVELPKYRQSAMQVAPEVLLSYALQVLFSCVELLLLVFVMSIVAFRGWQLCQLHVCEWLYKNIGAPSRGA